MCGCNGGEFVSTRVLGLGQFILGVFAVWAVKSHLFCL